jgi:hypothetical protein
MEQSWLSISVAEHCSTGVFLELLVPLQASWPIDAEANVTICEQHIHVFSFMDFCMGVRKSNFISERGVPPIY